MLGYTEAYFPCVIIPAVYFGLLCFSFSLPSLGWMLFAIQLKTFSLQYHFEAQVFYWQTSSLNTAHFLQVPPQHIGLFPLQNKSVRLFYGYEFSFVQLLQRLLPVEAEKTLYNKSVI